MTALLLRYSRFEQEQFRLNQLMRVARPKYLQVVLAAVAVIVLFLRPWTDASCPYLANSTHKMAKRLEEIAANANPEINLYINEKRLAYFRNKERPSSSKGQLELDKNLAIELLH